MGERSETANLNATQISNKDMIHDCPICWFRNELWGMMGLAGLEDHFHRAHIQWWGDMTPVWPLSVKGSDFRYLEQGYEREYKG